MKSSDPLEYNEGDEELEPYLDPLLHEVGSDVDVLDQEALKRAFSEGTLTVVGVKLWTALLSSNWRHREAAS